MSERFPLIPCTTITVPREMPCGRMYQPFSRIPSSDKKETSSAFKPKSSGNPLNVLQ